MRTTKLRTATIVIGILAASMPSLVAAQSEADAAGLREYVKKYQAEWNTHDSTKVAAFFSEDADLVMGNLPAARGREAIDGFWHRYFARLEPARYGRFEVTSSRFLGTESAIINVDSTTYGRGPKGGRLPERKARGTWVVHKSGGHWMIEAMRGQPVVGDRVELNSSLDTAKALRPGIRAFVESYADAFNAKDADALTALYGQGADIIVREQPTISGLKAIRETWKNYFAQPRPYRALLVIGDIRMLTDDVAVLNIIATGALEGSGGKLMPVRDAHATWVIAREDGEWKIAALRVLPGSNDRIFRDSTN